MSNPQNYKFQTWVLSTLHANMQITAYIFQTKKHEKHHFLKVIYIKAFAALVTDTTRAQINNILSKSHFTPLLPKM